ncbi:hypothetical protein [Shimia sp. MIT910701]|uniref:hypothetical protein n=1 Tax=Shimia sp. MIT910701 TaxID=3096987 RepID=UPI00399B60C5
MGELLNRGYQREILETLASAYPADVDIEAEWPEQEDNSLKVNLYYLDEHGLTQNQVDRTKDEPWPLPRACKITAAGLDFLEKDGGLGAILNTVTVRFEEEQFRSLIVTLVGHSELHDEEKETIIGKLKELPGHALNKIGDAVIAEGIDGLIKLLDGLGG